MFHFLPKLHDGVVGTTFSSSCDAWQWASRRAADQKCEQTNGIPGNPGTTQEVNIHTWDAAIRKASGGGWEELGYIIHLLEDLASPAHTRNDAHPPLIDTDPFERHTKNRIPQEPSLSDGLINFKTPQEVFLSMQSYTQRRFYSSDTISDRQFPGPTPTRSQQEYLYDAENRKVARRYGGFLRRGGLTIDRTIALEQFEELGPEIVRHVASLIWLYIQVANPNISNCSSTPKEQNAP